MEEVVIASSSIDGGIGCWDLQTGNELLRYKNCTSPSHGLVSVGNQFLASAQVRDSSSSGSIHYWSWHKPQVELKCFPANQIRSLLSDRNGTYLFGGSVSGDIYCWEVKSGRLRKKWYAHYKAVTCLVLSDDESRLISGSEDGNIRVWPRYLISGDTERDQAGHLYEHSISGHDLCVTDLVVGYGIFDPVIVSASEDLTCKVWNLSTGRLEKNIVFPTKIDAITLDPGEDVFYAGGQDGKIYIVAIKGESLSESAFGLHIIGTLTDQSSKAVTCLALCSDGVSLVSGSEDGLIRIWSTLSHSVIRRFKHAKGPVNNILVPLLPVGFMKSQASLGRRHASKLVPLEKYAGSTNDDKGTKVFIGGQVNFFEPMVGSYISVDVMKEQIKQIQQQGSVAATAMEVERLKADRKKAMEDVGKWKKNFKSLQMCVDEILKDHQLK